MILKRAKGEPECSPTDSSISFCEEIVLSNLSASQLKLAKSFIWDNLSVLHNFLVLFGYSMCSKSRHYA